MEFHEKLQELRKCRGLTQEELAEALYVSRTAVSKWESGRGYPSIDSLKELSSYFSVSIDDLLSAEKVITIAQRENKSNARNLFRLLFGMLDLLAGLLIVLPLYPETVDGYVYGVNLLAYTEKAAWNRTVYWSIFLALVLLGFLKILLAQLNAEKLSKALTACSVLLNIIAVVFLALARESYAATAAFCLLVFKGALLLKHAKSDR